MRADEQQGAMVARFRRFAQEAGDRSPLYAWVSDAIARDAEIVSLLAQAPPAQRRPNLLFAAVHDVLLCGLDHPLAAYYPSVGGTQPAQPAAVEAFRDLVAACRDEVVERVMTRSTQTNEPGRCAALRAALAHAAPWVARPTVLVELGSSAGLLLHLDRYRYCFGDVSAGPADSEVTIAPQLRRGSPGPPSIPLISRRVGIDLHPLDPGDPDDARWLKACVWPEERARLRRLDAALAVAAGHADVEHVTGDILAELAPVVRTVDPEAAVAVLHCATLAYLDQEQRVRIERDLDALGRERDLVRVCLEGDFVEPFATMESDLPEADPAEERFLLGLTTWAGGGRRDELLGRVQPHGAWLEWHGPIG